MFVRFYFLLFINVCKKTIFFLKCVERSCTEKRTFFGLEARTGVFILPKFAEVAEHLHLTSFLLVLLYRWFLAGYTIILLGICPTKYMCGIGE
jgi:hypothetical protein